MVIGTMYSGIHKWDNLLRYKLKKGGPNETLEFFNIIQVKGGPGSDKKATNCK